MTSRSIFSILISVISALAVSASAKSSRVIVAKDLKSTLKVSSQSSPGHSKLPLASDSSKSSSRNPMTLKLKPRVASHLPARKSRSAVASAAASRPASNEPLTNYVRSLKVGWKTPTPLLASGSALAVHESYLVTSADFVTEAWTNSGEVTVFYNDRPVQLIGFDLASDLAIFSTGLGTHMEKSLDLPRLRFDAHTMAGLLGRASGSGDQAFEMIFQLEKRPPMTISSSVLPTQASALQERWTTSFFQAAKKGTPTAGLDCNAEAVRVDDPVVAAELVRTKLVRCHDPYSVPLTSEYSIGLDFLAGEVSFVNSVTSYLAADNSKTTVFAPQASSERSIASVNLLTSPECEKSDAVNKRGTHMNVRFCTAALKSAPGLSDSTMTVVSTDSGSHSSVRSLRLHGFDAKNSKKFLQWLIDTEVAP